MKKFLIQCKLARMLYGGTFYLIANSYLEPAYWTDHVYNKNQRLILKKETY